MTERVCGNHQRQMGICRAIGVEAVLSLLIHRRGHDIEGILHHTGDIDGGAERGGVEERLIVCKHTPDLTPCIGVRKHAVACVGKKNLAVLRNALEQLIQHILAERVFGTLGKDQLERLILLRQDG